MISPQDITAGISSLRLAYDIAKGMKDIADAADRNIKIVELQSAIMDAQAGAIQAQQSHAADVQRITALEAEIGRLKAWEGEKQNYELKGLDDGPMVYQIKEAMRGSEPPHWLCTNCYQNSKKSIVQLSGHIDVGRWHKFSCPACSAGFQTRERPRWL